MWKSKDILNSAIIIKVDYVCTISSLEILQESRLVIVTYI